MATLIHFTSGKAIQVNEDPNEVRDKLLADPYPQLTQADDRQINVRSAEVVYWLESKAGGADVY